MKSLFAILMTLALNVSAHDEGHGPKLTDASQQGGIVAPVILAKDASLGTKANLKYKAEIVRSQDGIVRVYFYNQKMESLIAGVLAPKAHAILISGKKRKMTQQKFELQWKVDHFVGRSPKPVRKPYNIDVKVMEGATELLVAFDNLD